MFIFEFFDTLLSWSNALISSGLFLDAFTLPKRDISIRGNKYYLFEAILFRIEYIPKQKVKISIMMIAVKTIDVVVSIKSIGYILIEEYDRSTIG